MQVPRIIHASLMPLFAREPVATLTNLHMPFQSVEVDFPLKNHKTKVWGADVGQPSCNLMLWKWKGDTASETKR